MSAVGEVRERVRAGGLLAPGARVVAMLSGGRDSVCLLDVAVALCGSERVTALHVNYGLRPEAGEDEAHCRGLCAQLGIEIEVVHARREPAAGNLQAWARELRYGAAHELAARLEGSSQAGSVGEEFSEEECSGEGSAGQERSVGQGRSVGGRSVGEGRLVGEELSGEEGSVGEGHSVGQKRSVEGGRSAGDATHAHARACRSRSPIAMAPMATTGRGTPPAPGQALVATGHTATDQVETILYRLAASPGRRALLGMAASEGRLVRPLLGLTRDATAAYCLERDLTWREDESNDSLDYARARVRHGLLPAFDAVHPAARANVLRTAQLLGEETELLDALVEAELDGRDSIAVERLGELPTALARLVVIRLAEQATRTFVPQAGERVQELIELGRRGGRAELHVGGLAGAVVEGGELRMRRIEPRRQHGRQHGGSGQ